MKDLRYYIKNAVTRIIPALTVCSMALSSCDDCFIYDYEGDCSVNYLVQFKYDYNMKYADAFAHEVESVTLYLVDADGNIVWQNTESGSALAEDDYAMTVDVDPGDYTLLAWCGTTDNESFTVPAASVASGLTCTLNRLYDDSENAYVDSEVDRLYYGYLADQNFPETEGTYTYTVSLVKDTNIVTVVLQHLSGESVDPDDFIFYISDSNGSLDWDNSLIEDEEITYYAWYTAAGEAEIDISTSSDDTVVSMFDAAVAQMTVPRLVTTQSPRLNVLKAETEETVISIPLIDYLLLVKGYYNSSMDDQEYLDRQDEYSMTFFLDEGNRWIDTYIYINSWKVILQDSSI